MTTGSLRRVAIALRARPPGSCAGRCYGRSRRGSRSAGRWRRGCRLGRCAGAAAPLGQVGCRVCARRARRGRIELLDRHPLLRIDIAGRRRIGLQAVADRQRADLEQHGILEPDRLVEGSAIGEAARRQAGDEDEQSEAGEEARAKRGHHACRSTIQPTP